MRGRVASTGVWGLAACVIAALGLAPFAGAGARDDTQALQAQLDAGGDVFLPKLPNGQCYLTRGLWVTRDDTTITSDGACILALGPGEGRIKRADGSLVRANAVFFINHSDVRKPLPVRIGISDLHVRVAGRGQPALDVQMRENLGAGNAGPGIFLDLAPVNGRPVLASGIDVAGNRVVRNARAAAAARRAGIVVAGGQDDGQGEIAIHDNVFQGNRGPLILRRSVRAARPTRVAPSVALGGSGPVRDDTAWLQARLDHAGGTIDLPKLPNGECYATRGLWVSHDDTTITSNGAC